MKPFPSGSESTSIRRRENSIRREYRSELRRLEAFAVNWPQVQLKRTQAQTIDPLQAVSPEAAQADGLQGPLPIDSHPGRMAPTSLGFDLR